MVKRMFGNEEDFGEHEPDSIIIGRITLKNLLEEKHLIITKILNNTSLGMKRN